MLVILLIVIPLTLYVRPLLYVGVFISKPVLERRAAEIAKEPFSTPTAYGPEWVGCYYVVIGRCPHYISMTPVSVWSNDDYWPIRQYTRWTPAILYRYDNGSCERHARHLWGPFDVQERLGF